MKNLRVSFLFITFLTIALSHANAQKQAYNWYFGDHAGLSFTTSPPHALTNGALVTNEGCATVSDTAGNLLFYTDGTHVYNKLNDSMPNGYGLDGNSSSTESAMIIPKPGNSEIYYIFTLDCFEDSFANGLEYSTVDMTKDGGLGDVVSKNVPLLKPATEKMTAILHNIGKDIWVIAHGIGSDSFFSFLVTNSGVNTISIASKAGSVIDTTDAIGYLRASHDGKKLAEAIDYIQKIQIFNFDNLNGKVSEILSVLVDSLAQGDGVYGLEFSPDDTKLYAGDFFSHKLYQFNMDSAIDSAHFFFFQNYYK